MTSQRTKRTVLLSLLALLVGASSCTNCESCGGKKATDAGATSDAAADGATTAPATASTPSATPSASASTGPIEPNYACRTLARAITTKACACPQGNNQGCCYFGIPPAVPGAPSPYLDCSKGATDWPSKVETRACKIGLDEKKKDILMACFAAKDRLRCGGAPGGALGAEVPKECEAFLKEVTAAK